MNWVKSFVSGSKSGVPDGPADVTEEELGITHLNKVFTDYKTGKLDLSPVLPLFCKVFKSSKASVINEKFSDVGDFAKLVAEELVRDIRYKAEGKEIDIAAVELLQFLKGKGWQALCCVNICALSMAAVRSMCLECLPSTLLKMMYMFIDLPLTTDDLKDVITLVMSILIRLGQHVCVVEELIRADDLNTLFDICTCYWPNHNLEWQRCASECLSTICRQSLTQGTVKYLHEKKAINMCVVNLRGVMEKNVIVVVNMIIPLLGSLKDSCSVNDKLLKDFKTYDGYTLLTDTILEIEGILVLHPDNECTMEKSCLKQLSYCIPQICMSGFEQFVPIITAQSFQHQGKDFVVPVPTGKGSSVKNSGAFLVLQNSFVKCQTKFLGALILEVVSNIYRSDGANYFILEQHHTLSTFVDVMVQKDHPVQEGVLKLIEYVVFALNYVPSSELLNLSILLRDSPPRTLSISILATLVKLITAKQRLKDVLLELGFLATLHFCQLELIQLDPEDKDDDHYISMLMTTVNTMLEDNIDNVESYQEMGGRDCLDRMLHNAHLRSYSLNVIKTLSTYVNGKEEISSLLNLLQSSSSTELKLDVLDCIHSLFLSYPEAQYIFQSVGGFLYLPSVLVGVEKNSDCQHIEVVSKVLSVLQAALHSNLSNMYYFTKQIQFTSVTDALRHLKCFSNDNLTEMLLVLNFLMDLALDITEERCPPYATLTRERFNNKILIHPEVVISILNLISTTQNNTLTNTVCDWLLQLTLDQYNLELCCKVGVVKNLLMMFEPVFAPSHDCNISVMSLFEVLARHRLKPSELRLLLRLGLPLYCSRPEKLHNALCLETSLSAGEVDVEDGSFLESASTGEEVGSSPESSCIELTSEHELTSGVELRSGIDLPLDLDLPDIGLDVSPEYTIELDTELDVGLGYRIELETGLEIGLVPSTINSEGEQSPAIVDIVSPHDVDIQSVVDSLEELEHLKKMSSSDGDKDSVYCSHGDKDSVSCSHADKDSVSFSHGDKDSVSCSLGDKDSGGDSQTSLDNSAPDTESVGKPSVDSNESAVIVYHADTQDNQSDFGGEVDIRTLHDATEETDTSSKDTELSDPTDTVNDNNKNDNEEDVFDATLTLQTPPLESSLSKKREDSESSERSTKVQWKDVETEEEELIDNRKSAPVIISVEEIERLKSEMEINFPSDRINIVVEEEKEETISDDEDWSDNCDVFSVSVISNHIIELLVSLATPINGEQETIPYIKISKGTSGNGWFIPYAVKPGSLGIEKIFSTTFTLVTWYQICNDGNSEEWEITLFDTKELKLSLLPRTLFLATSDFMQSYECQLLQSDNQWHCFQATFVKAGKARQSTVDINFDNNWFKTVKSAFPNLVGNEGPVCIGFSPTSSNSNKISWKQGPMYLFDGILSSLETNHIFSQGPSYHGNFKNFDNESMPVPVLNINPSKSCNVTLDKIVQDIDEVEISNVLLKQLKVPASHVKSSPVCLFPNLSSHLLSYSTPSGAVLMNTTQLINPIGINGVFSAVGSSQVLLGLVAMVTDSEGLYAAVKLLTLAVIRDNELRKDMERDGYDVLALLLHRKADITSTHVLQLVMSLGAKNNIIVCPISIRVLLCCFDVWRNASIELQTQLFTCLYNLVINPVNTSTLQQLELLKLLLEFIFDSTVPSNLVQSALDVVSAVLNISNNQDILTLGSYLVYTLPTSLVNEHEAKEVSHTVKIRNMLLELMCALVQSNALNNESGLRLQLEECLGFDWMLLFMRPGLHHMTFNMTIRLFGILIHPDNGFARFSKKLNHGGWLSNAETKIWSPQAKTEGDGGELKGFPLLLHVLKGHTNVPQYSTYNSKLYVWLISLILNHSTTIPSLSGEFTTATLFSMFPAEKTKIFHKDPLVLLVCLIRADKCHESCCTVINFLSHFMPIDPIIHATFVSIVDIFISLVWIPECGIPLRDVMIKRHAVLDLLKKLILAELYKLNFDILDTVFEAQNIEFGDSLPVYQSTLLQSVMSDIENGTPDYSFATTKTFNKVAIFVCKFAVQKLWEGVLGTSTSILSSFVKLSENISKDSELPIIYCLHRTILYYLSCSSKETQKMILNVIHMVQEHYKTLFRHDIKDYEFVICFSHLLRSLPNEGDWGELIDKAKESLLHYIKDLRPDLIIYIEPDAKIPLCSVTKSSRSSMASIFSSNDETQFVIQADIAPKLFAQIKLQQLEGDKQLLTQRTSRRFTGLLTPRRAESQLTLNIITALHMKCEIDYTHTTNMMSLIGDNIKHSVQNTQLQFHKVYARWEGIQLQLTQERGLWGPFTPSHLDRWELDYVEGPHRTRKRLKLNDKFYRTFIPKSIVDYQISKFKYPCSSFSKEYYHFYGTRDRVDSLATISGASKISCAISARTVDADNRLMEDFLLPGETQLHVYACLRVEGLTTIASLLYLGRKSGYILDGYTLNLKGGITDIRMLMMEEWSGRFGDLLVDGNSVDTSVRLCHSIDYRGITEIVKRRYSLQENAMEVFCNGGLSFFVVFSSDQRNKAYHKLRYLTPSLTPKSDFASDVLSSARRHTREAGSIFSSFKQTNVTHRWEVGEISNFQYLMYINTLAGRAYTDLMQYPIFPWVLADYDSEELCFSDPATFRDLSKPMGAQTSGRLSQFQKRYNDWIDPHGTDTSPCHYGTFYSSAMITSGYLIRLEPFTSSFIHLQGGHFDLPDRLFHCIKDAWRSASEINMCDVRELIPEFFYLPEFLQNSNKFNLGRKQSGEKLGDVILPPWAKGCPHEFIRLHREALESDYVSLHLHQWIDLIFGCKQQGPAARKSANTFHCYFYEGNIDIANLNDPLRKSAVKGFINNFGQAPKQLFSRPHPSRKAKYHDMVRNMFHYNLTSLKAPRNEEMLISSPVQEIHLLDNNGLLAAGKNKVLVPNTYNYYFAWGLPDNSLILGSVEGKILHVYENTNCEMINVAICPDSKTLITGGTYLTVWGHNLVKKDYKLTMRRKMYSHTDSITCLASSNNHRLFVSGSDDRTVVMWDLNQLNFVRQLSSHPSPVSSVTVNDVSGNILTTAANNIYVWAINGELLAHTQIGTSSNVVVNVCTQTETNEWDHNNVIVTGSSDGVVRVWGLLYSKDTSLLSFHPRSAARGEWSAQLKMRCKLTMHTSFDRPDNREPAEITCLRFTEDHYKLYVGDTRGRIYCWQPNEETGKMADHWVKDSGAKVCYTAHCKVRFTFAERRHHCRQCGQLFCRKCTSYYTTIPKLNITHKVRVCKPCFNKN